MLRIAICDDSEKDANSLKHFCEASNDIEKLSITVFNNGLDLLKSHSQNRFDILFLDVDMPEIDGISIGKEIRKTDHSSIIIFVTAYPEYAIVGYECEAFFYLLKPASLSKIESVLKRAISKIGLAHKTHAIKIQNRTVALPITDIYYVECCRRHIIYHTEAGEYTTTEKLSSVYESLSKYGFYQVHQGYIVNFAKVKDFDGYTVVLKNNDKVLISVRKKKEVLLAYSRYIEKLS
jgi:DNA-binding LytR/AlgR family response regulator